MYYFFFIKNPFFFNPNLKTLNTYTDLHHPDLHSAQFFSLESHKISSAYTKTSLGLKSVCATGYKKLSDDPNYINFCEVLFFFGFGFVFGVFWFFVVVVVFVFCFVLFCLFVLFFFDKRRHLLLTKPVTPSWKKFL